MLRKSAAQLYMLVLIESMVLNAQNIRGGCQGQQLVDPLMETPVQVPSEGRKGLRTLNLLRRLPPKLSLQRNSFWPSSAFGFCL